ncbi:putative membrane protein [hydrocarbon metagenome]|uniref:Putative membrane protein n=1 Tax=hydrocarbon metagenome TaxID=938273 RepID=A0A0W8EZP9_9ZZZZ
MSELSAEASICHIKWGTFVLIGIMALVFGILFLTFPELTAEVIVILIGVIMIVLAILTVILALMSRVGDSSSVLLLVAGVLGFLVGMSAVIAPVLFGALLSIIIGVVFFVIGIVNIALAMGEKTFPHRWILFLLGLVSIIFAVLLMAYPVLGLVFLFGYLVGIYFVIYGILSLIAGLAIRKVAGDICTV